MTSASSRALAARAATAGVPRFRLAGLAPVGAGLLAGLALLSLYLGLVSWAQGFAHARQLLWDDRYFVAAIAGVSAG